MNEIRNLAMAYGILCHAKGLVYLRWDERDSQNLNDEAFGILKRAMEYISPQLEAATHKYGISESYPLWLQQTTR